MIDIPDGWAAVLVAMIGIAPATISTVLVFVVRGVRRDAAVAAHELRNNSGGSTRDAIDRIEAKLTNDYHRLQRVDRRLTVTGAGVVALGVLAAILHRPRRKRHA